MWMDDSMLKSQMLEGLVKSPDHKHSEGTYKRRRNKSFKASMKHSSLIISLVLCLAFLTCYSQILQNQNLNVLQKHDWEF